MIVGAVLAHIRQARYIRSILRKYRSALAPGKYYMFDNFRSLCLQSSIIPGETEQFFPVESSTRIRRCTCKVLNVLRYFYIGRGNFEGIYEALYIANNYDKIREIKLFSFKKKKVLTICTSDANATRQLEEYETFGKAYKMPSVTKNDQFENALEISMIERLIYPGEEQALTAIAMATETYNQNMSNLHREQVKSLISFDYGDDLINAYMADLLKGLPKDIMELNLPICLQHGDLSKDNLLFGVADGEEAFWWIDWEHVGNRVFFYDYFFYIINSAFYKDVAAFRYYISGRADAILDKFFSRMGVEFDSAKRWDYFIVFSIIFLKERVCDLGNIGALNRYCDLIKELKMISDGISI